MDIALNEVSKIIYRYKGIDYPAKEVYYTSGAAKFKVWPCTAYAKKIEMVKLDENGTEITRYVVNISNNGDTTTYTDVSGDEHSGLSPGKYAVAATISYKASIKDNKSIEKENCWCRHIIVNDCVGISYSSSEYMSTINVSNKTKYNPFTGENDPYTIFEIKDSDYNTDHYAYPLLGYVIRKPYSPGVESPFIVIGAIPGVESVPLRIKRETPTCKFELKSGSTVISSGTKIFEDTLLSPRYLVKWSSNVSQSYPATMSTSGDLFSLSKNGNNYDLKILKYPQPGSSVDSQNITLTYNGQTTNYQIIIPTKFYMFTLSGGNWSGDGTNGWILYDTSTVIVRQVFDYSTTTLTGFTLESSNTNAIGVSGSTITRNGTGTSTITVKYNGEIIGTFSVTAKLKDVKLRFKVQTSTSSTDVGDWTDVYTTEINNGEEAMILPIPWGGTPDLSNIGNIKQMRVIFLDENDTQVQRFYTFIDGSSKWSNSSPDYKIVGPCTYTSWNFPTQYCTYKIEMSAASYKLKIYYA